MDRDPDVHAASGRTYPVNAGPTESTARESPDPQFDGPWARILVVAVAGWAVLYGVDWALLAAATPAGAFVGFTHAYILAPLVAAAMLLDSLSLRERGVDVGVFRWLYALVALVAPPIVVVYYAHREWLKPSEPDLIGGP